MVTKGYGFTVEDIDWSCPADLEPYAKAHKLEIQEKDSGMYFMGAYNKIAFEVVMAHFGAGLGGKKSDAEYLKEPFMMKFEGKKVLTEAEKQRQVDLFFAEQEARRINWRRRHKKQGSTVS